MAGRSAGSIHSTWTLSLGIASSSVIMSSEEGKHLLLGLMVANPSVLSNLQMEAKRPESAITTAVRRKVNKYRGIFHTTNTLILLDLSMCETLGSETQALINVMIVRRVDLQEDVPTSRAHAAAEDRKVAYLHGRLFFVLQQALSQCTQYHLYR